jgi:hypothetical protein
MLPDDDYLARLQNAIRQLNHCESKYIETVTVREGEKRKAQAIKPKIILRPIHPIQVGHAPA